MADKRKNNGGHPNSGRKKGIGLSFDIKRHCDNMIREMLMDDAIRLKATKQLSLELDKDAESYLYIIKNSGVFKIGYTKNWKKRKQSYITHLPSYELVYLFKSFNTFDLEGELHILFNKNRVQGEWFNLSNEDIIKCISYCSSKID